MRYFYIALNALVLPKLYEAYLLIRLAPGQGKDGPVLTDQGYYAGLAALFLGLFILVYGAFVVRRYKWFSDSTRINLAWAIIVSTILIDSSIIYYLNSIIEPEPEALTLL